jgi:predicted 3-demethylubiquinone-9 3-methyltransferase (glyoxalase superfamily)
MSQKITPCLWFDGRIEEAAAFYAKTFKGRIKSLSHYPDGRPLLAVVEMLGLDFQLLNGGSDFKFSEAVSFAIDCEDQAEVDYYWQALTADGGAESQCSWCRDRFGLSWQVVPRRLPELLNGPDKAGASRAMQAMMQMKKIVVADIEKAYAGP